MYLYYLKDTGHAMVWWLWILFSHIIPKNRMNANTFIQQNQQISWHKIKPQIWKLSIPGLFLKHDGSIIIISLKHWENLAFEFLKPSTFGPSEPPRVLKRLKRDRFWRVGNYPPPHDLGVLPAITIQGDNGLVSAAATVDGGSEIRSKQIPFGCFLKTCKNNGISTISTGPGFLPLAGLHPEN